MYFSSSCGLFIYFPVVITNEHKCRMKILVQTLILITVTIRLNCVFCFDPRIKEPKNPENFKLKGTVCRI